MLGKAVLEFTPLEEGILLKRYKRFLVDIELQDGQLITAHCANTGPMKGVLNPGDRVRVRHAPSPARKLAWSWEQAEVLSEATGKPCWVGINTSLPNRLIQLVIEAGFLAKQLGEIANIRREVPYGKNLKSRIDLFLKPTESEIDSRQIFLEVKNTTWMKGGLALFPDTITTRGQKHLKDLMEACPESRSVLVPCLSRADALAFSPGDSADPEYGRLFRLAIEKGVEVIPCCFEFDIDRILWLGTRPVKGFEDS